MSFLSYGGQRHARRGLSLWWRPEAHILIQLKTSCYTQHKDTMGGTGGRGFCADRTHQHKTPVPLCPQTKIGLYHIGDNPLKVFWHYARSHGSSARIRPDVSRLSSNLLDTALCDAARRSCVTRRQGTCAFAAHLRPVSLYSHPKGQFTEKERTG